jgi:hypothetical protein
MLCAERRDDWEARVTHGPEGRDHSTHHITDVRTRRVVSRAGDGAVVIAWDYPGSTLLEVRILRSTAGHALSAGDEARDGSGQALVYHDVTGSFRDEGLQNGTTYRYTVFARHPGGEWVHWGDHELTPAAAAPVAGPPRGVLSLFAALLCLGALLAAAPAAHAAAQSAPEGGTDYVAAALADPAVTAALGGVTYESTVATWGGTAGAPAGATVTFTWPAAEARDTGGVWPLLVSAVSGRPVPPYETVEQRIRVTDITALRVDVLTDGTQVVQILPQDAATQFSLREQTWPPFSWFPWFTSAPWALLPVFGAVGVIIIVRAWRRSRAWNRRLPSMTRHDRQFIGRLVTILFLLAGTAWMIWQSVLAVRGPSAAPGGTGGPGDLSSLPSLLIPPAILLAALVLEFTYMPHRAAWALIAVLAGAAGLYYLASATWGTATNLDLSYYILLGVVCLIAAPRAFSAGRMGWSRSMSPRYG